jgi:hypothetical protein
LFRAPIRRGGIFFRQNDSLWCTTRWFLLGGKLLNHRPFPPAIRGLATLQYAHGRLGKIHLYNPICPKARSRWLCTFGSMHISDSAATPGAVASPVHRCTLRPRIPTRKRTYARWRGSRTCSPLAGDGNHRATRPGLRPRQIMQKHSPTFCNYPREPHRPPPITIGS